MRSLRALTTLFCHNLLINTSTTEYSHLILHHPSCSISANYRAGHDGCYATFSFTVSPDSCHGFAIQELDGEEFDGPLYMSWKSYDGYAVHDSSGIPEPAAWTELLPLFQSVELITERSVCHSTGAQLAAHPSLEQILSVFDKQTYV